MIISFSFKRHKHVEENDLQTLINLVQTLCVKLENATSKIDEADAKNEVIRLGMDKLRIEMLDQEKARDNQHKELVGILKEWVQLQVQAETKSVEESEIYKPTPDDSRY